MRGVGLSSYKIGLAGEAFVCFVLVLVGFSIVRTRYRNECGEVDIIACYGDIVSFIEVKCTFSKFLEFPLSAKQRRSILEAASLFMAENPQYSDYSVRFDLFLLSAARLSYISGAWGA